MPAGGLELGVSRAILGLGNADDHHHLIVRPDDIPVDALSFRVDGAAALIVELVRGAWILHALARDHIVVWRSSLQIVSRRAAWRVGGSSWSYESLRRQRPQPAHHAGQKSGMCRRGGMWLSWTELKLQVFTNGQSSIKGTARRHNESAVCGARVGLKCREMPSSERSLKLG